MRAVRPRIAVRPTFPPPGRAANLAFSTAGTRRIRARTSRTRPGAEPNTSRRRPGRRGSSPRHVGTGPASRSPSRPAAAYRRLGSCRGALVDGADVTRSGSHHGPKSENLPGHQVERRPEVNPFAFACEALVAALVRPIGTVGARDNNLTDGINAKSGHRPTLPRRSPRALLSRLPPLAGLADGGAVVAGKARVTRRPCVEVALTRLFVVGEVLPERLGFLDGVELGEGHIKQGIPDVVPGFVTGRNSLAPEAATPRVTCHHSPLPRRKDSGTEHRLSPLWLRPSGGPLSYWVGGLFFLVPLELESVAVDMRGNLSKQTVAIRSARRVRSITCGSLSGLAPPASARSNRRPGLPRGQPPGT